MGFVTTKDGVDIFYKDWGPRDAQVIFFHRNGTLKTYSGFPHGMPTTNADAINADLLAFIKES
ncbi:non-heme chloroperoxidase [Paraburkholderia phenazinium]|uniref:Non-heme chloroperoxidase n=1 Tax=Paraburkholderia phenazinium TaxID=60549 RepID=A0A1G7ZFB5_9BURK|nr:hypothetical protein [Paraburkholderia phenazinium]SDH07315.1 non-heme chloroperoxidase [Paraburkholderia phenazinium]